MTRPLKPGDLAIVARQVPNSSSVDRAIVAATLGRIVRVARRVSNRAGNPAWIFERSFHVDVFIGTAHVLGLAEYCLTPIDGDLSGDETPAETTVPAGGYEVLT